MALRTLSLCAGGGGLDLSLRLASRILGFEARTVCYVEREAYAVEVLAARIQDRLLDDAPIWSDLKTFDPRPWRGLVDCVIGGYPCQPFSHAGRRLGEEDPRHLWPYIHDIIAELGPRLCFFENVDGHLSKGFEEVRGELRGLGYEVEAGIFTAEEVGAGHQRRRLFILAHRNIEGLGVFRRGGVFDGVGEACRDDVDGQSGEGVSAVVDPPDAGRRPFRLRRDRGGEGHDGVGQEDGGSGIADEALAHTEGARWLQPARSTDAGTGSGSSGSGFAANGRDVADPSLQQLHDGTWNTGPRRRGEHPDESGPLFPPTPDNHDAWLQLLTSRGDLAPALPLLGARGLAEVLEAEPDLRREVDGVAAVLDYAHAHRAERLQLLGNGVVPVSAAYAFCILAEQGGLVRHERNDQ